MSEKFSINKRFCSFKHAFAGLGFIIKNEHNFRIHILAAISAIILGIVVGINNVEWIFITISIVMVISAEIFNSAVEMIVDLVSPDIQKKAGLIKDMAAGAVLVLSIGSLVVGFIIFLPKIADQL